MNRVHLRTTLFALVCTLVAAGAGHGLLPAGYRAIDALRLEKGYGAFLREETAKWAKVVQLAGVKPE